MKIKKTVSYILILTIGLTISFSACEKNEEPMELPPAESMVIDWDMFPSIGTKSAELLTPWNWLYSEATVVVWNTVVAVNIVIPTVAYVAAFNYEPVYLGDNTWEWSYSVPVYGKTIVARLLGARIDNETFSMEMTLSETGGFQEFKWFEGVIRYDHTEANWTLSHSPDNGVEYLDIQYSKNFETDVADIRYTVIDPQNDLFNAYIDFEIDPAMDFDARYSVSRNDTATFIEWSSLTKAGRVMDARHFGDELWHCWDSQLQDVVCPDEKRQFLLTE